MAGKLRSPKIYRKPVKKRSKGNAHRRGSVFESEAVKRIVNIEDKKYLGKTKGKVLTESAIHEEKEGREKKKEKQKKALQRGKSLSHS